MKQYVSSVLVEKDRKCVVPVPTYLCETLGLKENNFLSNLFDHGDSRETGNRYEVIISPFKRNEMDSAYRMRMRVGSGTGTTHKVLELLKSEEMFEFDVRVIDAIDAISAESGEVAVTGIVRHGNQTHRIWPTLRKSKWHIATGKGKLSHQWAHTFSEDSENKPKRGIHLIIEKSFVGDIYRGDLSKKLLIDEPTKIDTKIEDEENLYLILNAPLISNLWPSSKRMYSFVSIRLDEERAALVITLKDPREKLFLFKLRLEEKADIRQVTNVLSNSVGLNFRSISSVTNSDRSVEVKLVANVTDSGFENLSLELIQEYIQLKNERQNILIEDTRDIVYPLIFNKTQYPTYDEIKELFEYSWFEFGRENKNRQYTLRSTNDIINFRRVRKLCRIILNRIKNSDTIETNDLKMVIASHFKNHKCVINYDKTNYPEIVWLKSERNSTTCWNAFIRADCYVILGWSNNISSRCPLGKCQKTAPMLASDFREVFRMNVITFRNDFVKLYNQILMHIVENNQTPKTINIQQQKIYYPEEPAGEGKSGKVYLGIRYTGIKPEKIAIKISDFPPNLAEAKILGRKCPNLVKYDDFVDNGKGAGYSIIMEFLHGRTLQEILSNPVINEFKITEQNWKSILQSILRGIIDGVAYIHNKKNIIHLDLKPDNIMVLSPGKRVKILDYGLSGFKEGHEVAIDSERQNPAYMAPEVLKKDGGKVKACPTMDIFSLGVLASVLFLDEHPYKEYVGTKGLTEPAKNPNVLKVDNFSRVIFKACSFDPANRYSSIVELGKNLYSSWRKINPPISYKNFGCNK